MPPTRLHAGQSSRQQLDAGDEEPSHSAFDGSLEVLCQAAVTVEPCQCPFDRPVPLEELKSAGGFQASHNLDGPIAEAREGDGELVTAVGSVGKHMPQPRM